MTGWPYSPCSYPLLETREGGEGRVGWAHPRPPLPPSLPQWMTSRSLATERCAVSTLWEPPGTLTWKSKEEEPWFVAGVGPVVARGGEGAGEDGGREKQGRRSVLGHRRAHCGSCSSPRRPREGARGGGEGPRRPPVGATRSGTCRSGCQVALHGGTSLPGQGHAEMRVVHRSHSSLGAPGRAAGRARMDSPEPGSPVEWGGSQEAWGKGHVDAHRCLASLLRRALGTGTSVNEGAGTQDQAEGAMGTK